MFNVSRGVLFWIRISTIFNCPRFAAQWNAFRPVLIPPLGLIPLARKYSTTWVQPLKQAHVNASASACGSLPKRPPSYHLMTQQGEPSEGVSNSGARREKSQAINPRTASWKDMSLWSFIVSWLRERIVMRLTGRGDYIQHSILSI